MTLDGTWTFLVGNSRPAVIDPGPDDPRHLRAILDALGGAAPVAILLTHRHPDHAALADRLAAETGAPIGQGRAETDAGPLEPVPTPGHTPDHVCFRWGEALFVGDLLMGEGDTTLVAFPEGNLRAYLESLQRVSRLSPRVMYPAHGPTIKDPETAIGRYLRHREARIQQVREAIQRSGSSEPTELVGEVYGPDLHPALRGAAEDSVRAILDYLR